MSSVWRIQKVRRIDSKITPKKKNTTNIDYSIVPSVAHRLCEVTSSVFVTKRFSDSLAGIIFYKSVNLSGDLQRGKIVVDELCFL